MATLPGGRYSSFCGQHLPQGLLSGPSLSQGSDIQLGGGTGGRCSRGEGLCLPSGGQRALGRPAEALATGPAPSYAAGKGCGAHRLDTGQAEEA